MSENLLSEAAADGEAVVLVVADDLADQAVQDAAARRGPVGVQAEVGADAALEPVDAGVAVQGEQVLVGELEVEAVLVRDVGPAELAGPGAGDDLPDRLDHLRAGAAAVAQERPMDVDRDLRVGPGGLGRAMVEVVGVLVEAGGGVAGRDGLEGEAVALAERAFEGALPVQGAADALRVGADGPGHVEVRGVEAETAAQAVRLAGEAVFVAGQDVGQAGLLDAGDQALVGERVELGVGAGAEALEIEPGGQHVRLLGRPVVGEVAGVGGARDVEAVAPGVVVVEAAPWRRGRPGRPCRSRRRRRRRACRR